MAAYVTQVICRRSWHPWPRIVTWSWPKTWRTWKKKDSGCWCGWGPDAVLSRWGEPAGQWQHAQTMAVPRAPPQLSEHSDDCSRDLPNPDTWFCDQREHKPSWEGYSGILISSSATLTMKNHHSSLPNLTPPWESAAMPLSYWFYQGWCQTP